MTFVTAPQIHLGRIICQILLNVFSVFLIQHLLHDLSTCVVRQQTCVGRASAPGLKITIRQILLNVPSTYAQLCDHLLYDHSSLNLDPSTDAMLQVAPPTTSKFVT